jgi:hypothetical protein
MLANVNNVVRHFQDLDKLEEKCQFGDEDVSIARRA